MINDTKNLRAKILVEETRKFFLQIIFAIGMFIFIIFRSNAIFNFLLSMNLGIFTEFPIFILFFIGGIFLLILVYKYYKIYSLQKSFKSRESDKKLKKYMKTKQIPKSDEVYAKFEEEKNKNKKKFYNLVIRVIIVNILLFILLINYLPLEFFIEIILVFSILNIIYRYLIVFHGEKEIFGKKWENKKIEKYIQEFENV